MNRIPKLLSKTKLLRGYRCQKSIYLTVHNPELEAAITPETQALFDQGNKIGALARSYFPGGTLVDNVPWDFSGALNKTRILLDTGVEIIYEAAFEYLGCYARADIICYSHNTKRFSIYEVKSSTKVKPEHIHDVGLQTWIMAKSGLPIEQIYILHLNPECRYPDLSNLFKEENVTEEIRANYLSVQPKVREIIHTLYNPIVPDIDIGPHCITNPECGFKEYCWQQKNIPQLSVFNIPKIRDKKWELYQQGIVNFSDPRVTDLSEWQERIIRTHRSGERYINHAAIKEELAKWQFPLIFLDFETINPAIPRFDGCSPFQHTPFQFSVHIWPSPETPVSHIDFLHDMPDDPRPTLIPALLSACGTEGSIVAYYADFESARIVELAAFYPEYREALTALLARLVDPLPLIREHVYDCAFAGSFSLKSVAPALLGENQSYDGMLVANGSAAQRAFEELISPDISTTRKMLIRNAMLEYCKKDTFVMVELVKWLYQQ